jgi:prepilin-type N-terminal cleavage/methylation domain-containing protein
MRVRRDSATRDGFSMIELMVVVIIIGLISGIAMVSWEAILPNQKFNSAVRKLSEVLHGTRSEAIARSREFQIWYDLDNDSYRVRTPFRMGGGLVHTDDEEEDRLWTDETELGPEGIDILEVRVDDQVYSQGTVYVRFDPLGASSYHTVVLAQPLYERTFTIEAMPLTGDIRFHDGRFERELAEPGDFD